MKRKALVMTIVLIALAACGSDQSRDLSSVPDPVPNEQALELIRDCRVSGIEASHAGDYHLTLENDRRVQVSEPSGIWEAAEEVSDKCPEMEFSTE
jgi:hypothetical protein